MAAHRVAIVRRVHDIPDQGSVKIPEERLTRLRIIHQSELLQSLDGGLDKLIYSLRSSQAAAVEFVDVVDDGRI